jgi:hypothetical protein
MARARHHAHLIVHALMWGVLVEAAYAARPHSIVTWLCAGPIAISGGWASALAADLPEEPLRLPRIAALDLRPVWEQHPFEDRLRRGEREWMSRLEHVAGWYVARSPGYRSYRTQRALYEAYVGRAGPRTARLRLPRIARLDLRRQRDYELARRIAELCT